MNASLDHGHAEPALRRGRPSATTAATLCDAAFELFQLNGYDDTSVADIARTAGVSRATFFNYFDAKSDVFWLEVDRAIERLAELLSASDPNLGTLSAIRAALAAALESWDSGKVPWLLTQWDLIGRPAAASDGVTQRVTLAQRMLSDFVAEREGLAPSSLLPRVVATTFVGASIAAIQTWAATEPPRGHVHDYLTRALAPLADGFANTLTRSAQ